jgi:hypothetical protein
VAARHVRDHRALVEARSVEVLRLRDQTRYEFSDVIHLSRRGACFDSQDHFKPIFLKFLEAARSSGIVEH